MTIYNAASSSDSIKIQIHDFENFSLYLKYSNSCIESVLFIGKNDVVYPLLPESEFHILSPVGKFGNPVRSHQEMLLVYLDRATFFVNKNEISRFSSIFPFDFLSQFCEVK